MNRVRKIIGSNSGMTLVEVIVSMTLITMQLTMLSTVLISGMRCQNYLTRMWEMRKVSDMVLRQLTSEVEHAETSEEPWEKVLQSWIGKRIHEEYEVEHVEWVQEFPETIRIDLALSHIKTGAVHRSFDYVYLESDAAPEEADGILIYDLLE